MSNLKGLEQVALSPKENDEVYELLRDAYVPREPVCIGLRASYDELKPLFESLVPHTLTSGASIGLREASSGKVVAYMLNLVIDSPDFELFQKGGLGSEKADLYSKLMQDFCAGVDVFNGGQFKKNLELLLLCVHPSYGGRGIAAELIKMSENKGRAMGCDIATIQAVNVITDHIARKLGYQEICRIDMKERTKENGEALVDMELMEANGTTHLIYLSKRL
ncbi:uncharacterized protein LOC135201585 [Macrobrachium nipponense]|uniref:uncharacterized protein LOC135201585 n=1 Tax=Macrobrachium nipponense TaxID=159736 RepID=UPI0030C89620